MNMRENAESRCCARCAAMSLLAFAGLCASAHGGIRYWDNSAFKAYDVGDYVQDGLVLNYDGIRNAGADLPHDPAATTWVNCANPGTYDMTRYSLNLSGTTNWVAGAAHGYWTDHGFVFNTNAVFHESASFTIPTKYTIQALVDAQASKQTAINYEDGKVGSIGYVMCPYRATGWGTCSLGLRRDNFSYDGTKIQYSFYIVSSATGGRPAFGSSRDIPFSYATAIVNEGNGVMFSGTVAPWSAAGTLEGHRSSTTTSPSAYTFSNGFSLGGHYNTCKENFAGTIKSYRFYNRCLSDAEVLWNRVVDDARYFGRSREITVIPATNVVETSTIPGQRDYHYALDAEGFTFTAPAQRTVAGKRYTLGGYTLETWNGSAWGAPVSHDGEKSCALPGTTALVRLTWQYAAAADEGSLVVYDVGDYVQDGLVWNYDGIRNVGANVPHDPASKDWVNLGSAGSANDLHLQRLDAPGSGNTAVDSSGMAGGRNPGAWTEDGYSFVGESRFRAEGPVNAGTDYTLQVLMDANADDQPWTIAYLLSASWNNFALAIRRADNTPKVYSFFWNQQGATYRPYIYNDSHSYDYGTAIMNGTALTAAFFDGTTAPTSGGLADGFHKYDSLASFSATGYAVGGYGSADGYFGGVLKFMRFYNRPLSNAEVAHNRRVDNYRYFGICEPETTNVVVCSTYSYLEGYDACGAYAVDGSYTFVAPESVTAANGITYVCDGYTVETLKANGTWGAAVAYASNAYAATGSGTVRLTWRWKATHGLRSAADYDVTDYVAGGLNLHFDGIVNAGVGSPRTTANTANTKWVNLGENGAASSASLTKGNGSSSDWTEDGYHFDGNAKFTMANAGVKAGSSYTIQLLMDVDKNEQKLASDGSNQHDYFLSGSYNQFAVSVYGKGNAYLRAGVDLKVTLGSEERLTYFTGLMDQTGASPVAYAFRGILPASGTKSTDAGLKTPTVNSPILGAWGGGASQYGIGTVKSFRYYNRVLTEEELVRNRNVDSARFFGELATTNVFVVAGGGTQAETGAYKVEGGWTFTAATVEGPRGVVENAVRYTTEELVNGVWTNKTYHDGNSYTYTEGKSPAAVRLTWKAQPIGTSFTIR